MSFSLATYADLDRDFGIGPNGRLLLSVNEDAVVDRLTTRLSKWLGDWYLDTSEGIDYKNKILGQSGNGGEISAILRREILQEPDVDQIETFSLTTDSNNARGFAVSVTLSIVGFDESVAVVA